MPSSGNTNQGSSNLLPGVQRHIEAPIACEKAIMVSHEDYLYVFGGYGHAPEQLRNYPLDPIFDLDPSSSWSWQRGWYANTNR